MLITRLALENFKSYADLQLALRPGTIAILGANGAGKSSILEAIGFVLFDHMEEGIRLPALLREGATSGAAVVTIRSSFDQREYEVERRFTAKTTSRYRAYDVELGRRIMAEGNKDVQAWLHQHLCIDVGMDLGTLFRNTVGVPQGTFTAPFLLAASQRKPIFDPLLQAESYRKASDNLLVSSNHLERQAYETEREIAGLEGQLAALPGLLEEQSRLHGTLRQLDSEIAELRARLEAIVQDRARLDEAERSLRELTHQTERARADRDAQASMVKQAERLAQEAEAALASLEQSRAGHLAYLEAEERLRALDAQRHARDQLLKSKTALETQHAKLQTRLEQIARELLEIADAEERMRTLAPQVARQSELEAALHEAESEVTRLREAQRRERELLAEAARAQEDLSRSRSGAHEAEALDQRLRQWREELDGHLQTQRALGAERAAAQAERERLRKQSAALQEGDMARCPVCEAPLTPEHRDELVRRNAERMDELAAALQGWQRSNEAAVRAEKDVRSAIAQAEKRLRELPSAQALAEVERRFAERQAAAQSACEETVALAEAPARALSVKAELAILGDPRHEYQRCEDRARGRARSSQEEDVASRQIEDIDRRITQVDQELAAYAQLDSLWSVAQKTRDQHREAHDAFLAHSKTAEQAPARRANLAREQATHEALEVQLARSEARLAQAACAYDSDQHARLKAQEAQWGQDLAGRQASTSEQQRRLGIVASELTHLGDLQAQLDEKRIALQELGSLRTTVESVRRLLKEAGPLVTRRLVQRISWEATSLYGDIMEDHAGRLEWSEDYELALELQGQRRVFRQLSGGEQMTAALALRLALLRQISAVDTAFFDEPTAHLDPERRASLADRIMQVKGFSQLFVISHDDTFERAAQSYVRVVKDAAGSHCVGS